jgi:hypothetical protein
MVPRLEITYNHFIYGEKNSGKFKKFEEFETEK